MTQIRSVYVRSLPIRCFAHGIEVVSNRRRG